ncbi:MAG TPA: hypothetical protein VGP72_01195 [Planctomycetota bacterium]|jgi:hypothetical protein
MSDQKKQPIFSSGLAPHFAASKSWLIATALQGLTTAALIAVLYLMRGSARESHVRFIVVIGIVATWSLALRTIRARLVELMRHWQQASCGLLKRASHSGRHWIPVPLNEKHDRYIRDTMWCLRLIAAGLTIPFFVMPLVCSAIAVLVAFNVGPLAKEEWAGFAMFTMISAVIVAGYFHWAILPLPAPVRVEGLQRPAFPSRIRRRPH